MSKFVGNTDVLQCLHLVTVHFKWYKMNVTVAVNVCTL